MRFYLRILLILIMVVFSSLRAESQHFQSRKEKDNNKPLLFQDHPDTSDVHPNFFNVVSSLEISDKVTIQVTQGLTIKGIVKIIEETIEYRKVLVESKEIPSLKIILSHTIENEYIGFVKCNMHRDMLFLYRDKTTKEYIWIKREVSEILPD